MSNDNKQFKIGQALDDENHKGKQRPWRQHKFNNLELSKSFKRIWQKEVFEKNTYFDANPNLTTAELIANAPKFSKFKFNKRAKRAKECGTFLTFRLLEDGKLKLKQAKFCQISLCPMCGWRRSLKLSHNISKVALELHEQGYRFLLLTLTVKNIYGKDLAAAISMLTKAFKKLTNYKQFKDSIEGYVRVLEITHDIERKITGNMYAEGIEYYEKYGFEVGSENPNYDKYHPHFHVLLAVKEDYFYNPNLYISQEKFAEMWQKALKVDYTPVVDIRAIKGETKAEISKAIKEVAKYTTKSGDYLIGVYDIYNTLKTVNEKMTDEAVKILTEALHKRKLVGWGGIINDIRKKLDIEEEIKAEVNINGEAVAEGEEETLLIYKWFDVGFKNYRLVEVNKPELKSKYRVDPKTENIIDPETGEVIGKAETPGLIKIFGCKIEEK